MAVRAFTDSEGTSWRVWNTRPSKEGLYSAEFSAGWLTFESAKERRRLAPIPRDWEEVSLERLGLFCRMAIAVQRRSSNEHVWTDETGAIES